MKADANIDYCNLYLNWLKENIEQFSGFEVGKSDRRKGILDSVTSAHGVTVQNGNELTINCTINDLAMKKHMLAQCMMKVSDMFYLPKPNVQPVFLDDVQGFLDLE